MDKENDDTASEEIVNYAIGKPRRGPVDEKESTFVFFSEANASLFSRLKNIKDDPKYETMQVPFGSGKMTVAQGRRLLASIKPEDYWLIPKPLGDSV